jgi:hypothetical protein
MKSIYTIAIAMVCGLSATSIQAAVNCIEVQAFAVNRDNVTNKDEARAASIPEPRLMQIQIQVAKEIAKEFPKVKVVKTGEDKCEATADSVIVSGQLADFKKGNRGLRYISMGIGGAQKLEVAAKLTGGDGKVIAEKEVSDRKGGGIMGGSDKKGIQDFAEKIADFVKISLKKASK